jgi:Cu+-exporting ATPase
MAALAVLYTPTGYTLCAMEIDMVADNRANVGPAPGASGCGCSSKAAKPNPALELAPVQAGCCGGSGHQHNHARDSAPAEAGCCGGGDHAHDHHHDHDQHAAVGAGTKVLDPVCGMTVDPATAKYRADYAGSTYYFCSAGCQSKFTANPAKYLNKTEPKADAPKTNSPKSSVPEGTIYTCPMHPQVRQSGPGNCPICGMALEPEVATLDNGAEP